MKSNRKIKILILIILKILIIFLPLFTNNLNFKNSEFSKNTYLDYDNLKISKESGKIHIDDSNPSMNWSVAKNDGICTGNGTYSDPYIIEDLVIDGGGSGDCILIENSDVYFRIENCTVYNTGFNVSSESTGIELNNTRNGMISDNNCSFSENGIYLRYSDYNIIMRNNVSHNQFGVRLYYSDFTNVIENCVYDNYWGILADGLFPYTSNNSISANIVKNNGIGITIDHSYYTNISENISNNNTQYGIFISRSEYDNVLGNTVNHNTYGIFSLSSNNISITGNIANNNIVSIYLLESKRNMVSGNIMHNCGLLIFGENEGHYFHDIDNLNLVNGKPFYYYSYKINLGPSDFTNAGQVILVNCNDSSISNLNTSFSSIGISLYYSNGINITNNVVNYNNLYGIHLYQSGYNILSGNSVNNNSMYGIYLHQSNYNTISGNTLIGNKECIKEEYCQGNTFSDNGDCTYGQKNSVPLISGYDLIFLLGVLSVISITVSKKLKNPKN